VQLEDRHVAEQLELNKRKEKIIEAIADAIMRQEAKGLALNLPSFLAKEVEDILATQEDLTARIGCFVRLAPLSFA
jgi:hypothetical protein